jgi:hypothetical protein
MLLLFGKLFTLIPGLTSLGQSWINDHYNAQTQQLTAKYGLEEGIARQIIVEQEAVQTKWWFVAAIPPLFALPFVIYVWRAIAYDKVWMNGTTSTDPINGSLGTVFIMIVSFYFIKGFAGR